MAWHKDHTVTCIDCGISFVTRGNRAKRCKACAKEYYKTYARQKWREQQGNDRVEQVDPESARGHVCDTPEQIQACLNCTAVSCEYGQCPLNKSLGRRLPSSHHRLSEEKVRKILALRADGLTHREIAQELGISASTVGRWIRELGGTEDHA